MVVPLTHFLLATTPIRGSSAVPVEPPTEAPTEPVTEPPTEAPTEPVTEPPTEAPTEQPTEEGFIGALLKLSAALIAQNYSAGGTLSWGTEVYDYGGWHEGVTNPTRLTVPAGVSRVRVWGHAQFANATGIPSTVQIRINKNGSANYDGSGSIDAEWGLSTPSLWVTTAVISVTPGDYFELFVFAVDTSVDVSNLLTSFAIEKIE